MSNAIFPKLKGEGVEIWKQPEFKTSVFEPMSGMEARTIRRQYPRWSFGLPIQFLLDNQYTSDLLTVLNFFLAHRGRGESFLFEDGQGWSADNAVTGQLIGYGDGVKTEFQLRRWWAGITEPVNNPNLSWVDIYVDGELSPPTEHAVSSTGLIIFTTPPADGSLITWTGKYYYRVRFLDDQYKFVQSSKNYHSCDDLQFTGSVRNIV